MIILLLNKTLERKERTTAIVRVECHGGNKLRLGIKCRTIKEKQTNNNCRALFIE